jgi:hypothetical protein
MNTWIEGVDYYVNEAGLMVLTEKYLRERGYCCGNGCKHCPFEYKNVPEPKRSEMVKLAGRNRGNPTKE